MNDEYLRFCNSVQALRRQVEQIGSTVASALGVRASIYPHQVGTVWRILADLQIRHLLADEVGLGKTVQALMVINAVRLESPNSKVAIVVPDSLMPQWRDELQSRGHEAPEFEETDQAGTARNVCLFWPKKFKKMQVTGIDPKTYPFVVIDELHNLPVEIRDNLAHNARKFTGLLALTATPKFQDPARRLELLALLEPDRVYLAAKAVAPASQWSQGIPFRRWPQELQEEILAKLLDEERAVADMLDLESDDWISVGLDTPPSHAPSTCAALRWCLHRRVIRSRRSDFRGLLPERVHVSTIVEPTAGEVDRQHAIWKFIRSLPTNGTIDRELLARRSIIGPHTLRVRVRELVRSGSDPDGLLAEIDPHLVPDEGDTRLDALVDILAAIWIKYPKELVVVACQDSSTVDYLSQNIRSRLSEIGPIRQRQPLEVAEIRGGKDDAPEDIIAADSPAQQALARFQRGDAQLLLASDVAHVGLNLQCARVLVLYSVPWGPDEIEQWVGRLDRIGNSAISRDGDTLPIDVQTIVQHGLIDEQIVDVLSHFEVFTQVLDLEDATLLTSAHNAVSRGALDGAWAGIDDAVRQFEDIDVRTPLQKNLPYGPSFANHVYAQESVRPPAEPSLAFIEGHRPNWRWREISLEVWLRLLNQSGEYDIRKRKDPTDPSSKYRTLWYTNEAMRRDDDSIVILPTTHDPMERSPVHAEAFFTRRNEIRHPPRREVTLDVKFTTTKRPLQYLNHGSLLHEDLVNQWTDLGREASTSDVRVVFPRGHPAISDPGEGKYAITVGWIDAGTHVLPSISYQLDSASEAVKFEVLPQAIAAHRNDKWWIRGILPAQMMCYIDRLASDRKPERVENSATFWTLLQPFMPDPNNRDLPRTVSFNEVQDIEGIERHSCRAHEFLKRQMVRRWHEHAEELSRAVRTRLFVLAGEDEATKAVNNDLVAQEEIKVANVDPSAARIVHDSAKAKLRDAIAIRDALEHLNTKRRDRLDQVISNLATPNIGIHSTIIMTVKSE